MTIVDTTPSPSLRATPSLDRASLVRTLVRLLRAVNVRWAFQGQVDAVAAWCARTDGKDLDLWVAAADVTRAEAALDALGGVRIASADDAARLRHRSWWVEVDGRPAVIDLTVGDLAVGPLLLCPEADIEVRTRVDDLVGEVPVLDGVARALDLVARPVLRGRHPGDERLVEGRLAWWAADVGRVRAARTRLRRELGSVGRQLVAVLGGDPIDDALIGRARRLLARRSLRPASLRSSWAQRWAIAPSRRGVGPGGIRTSGTLVVLVGTDGSGKSTVAADLTDRLETAGFTVTPAYFGMARGNLPGVGLARRLLGVAPAGDGAPEAAAPAAPEAAAPAAPEPVWPDVAADPTVDPDEEVLAHPHLRRIAAWYYAVEYGWRWLTTVAPAVRRGEIVVCDRYVYDLRTSPWPGSRAAAFAQRLAGRPDVLALPDAPAEAIHARKPERSVAAIRAQQAAFHALLAEHPARCAEIVVDTSGRAPDAGADLYRATIAAAHRRTAPPR